MATHPVPTCACCGVPTPDEKRIDVRFNLPDRVVGGAESARRYPSGLRALLETDDDGCFIRCLLPIALTEGTELVLGTWLRVSEADLGVAQECWEAPEYDELTLEGTIANAIRPWGDDLLGAPVTVGVRDRNDIPYVTGSRRPEVSRILTTTWNRDYVLSRFAHALPVPVRTRAGDRWSIERTPGLAESADEGGLRFTGPGRTVIVNALTHPDATAEVDTLLPGLLRGAPEVPPGRRITERQPGRTRHALWTAVTGGGREQHEFYGFDVVPGAALAVVCICDDRGDLAWAEHVWRSISVEEGAEAGTG